MSKNWHLKNKKDYYYEGETVILEYEKVSDKQIKRITKSCSCSQYKLEGNDLTIWITTDMIKNRLNKFVYEKQEEKHYMHSASIFITYDDYSTEELILKLKIVEINGNKNANKEHILEG